MVCGMPELGMLSNKAAAKLAGLAPLAQDSGKKQGKRPVRGGRRQLRAVLPAGVAGAGVTVFVAVFAAAPLR